MKNVLIFLMCFALVISLNACRDTSLLENQDPPSDNESIDDLDEQLKEDEADPKINEDEKSGSEDEKDESEYGVLERGDGYVIYDSSMFGEITLYCGEIALPGDGESLTFETPIELFRTEETGYYLPVTGVSRDGHTWRFSTPLTEAPFLEISEFKLLFLTADHKVTVSFHCDVDENMTPILSENGTVTYIATAAPQNGETVYLDALDKFEETLGYKVEDGKNYFRVYTVKAPPVHK